MCQSLIVCRFREKYARGLPTAHRVSVAIYFLNYAFLNNNVASAHCVNISNKSTQGVETPCLLESGLLRIENARNDDDDTFYCLIG